MIEEVMTLKEAGLRWNVDPNSLRQRILRNAGPQGPFQPGEVRKSADVWLITRDSMERMFGPAKDQ